MDYKIIAANAVTGQIHVEYTDAGIQVAVISIDVPIVNNAFITGAALDIEIQERAPTWLMTRAAHVAAATGFDTISAQVEAPPNSSSETAPAPRISLNVEINDAMVAAAVQRLVSDSGSVL